MMTHEAIRARLRAMQVEINSALSYTADGRYDLALECVAALEDCGMGEMVEGLDALDKEHPYSRDLNGEHEQLDAAEYR